MIEEFIVYVFTSIMIIHWGMMNTTYIINIHKENIEKNFYKNHTMITTVIYLVIIGYALKDSNMNDINPYNCITFLITFIIYAPVAYYLWYKVDDKNANIFKIVLPNICLFFTLLMSKNIYTNLIFFCVYIVMTLITLTQLIKLRENK